jgi:hypothetical protein
MFATLLPAAAVVVCLAHPADIDRDVMKRALPWLPPDLARQVNRHDRDFLRGAALAAVWPKAYHQPGSKDGIEASLLMQCQRLVAAIRGRQPFVEIVAGLGVLEHFVADLNSPFPGSLGASAYAQSYAQYVLSSSMRIPVVYYGQPRGLLIARSEDIAPYLVIRRDDMAVLTSIIQEDMDRLGGPSAWRSLDDRSSTFGATSLFVNHTATDFANLASWVWAQAGGLVPEIPSAQDALLVWKGELKPREIPSPRLSLGQKGR